MKYSDQSRGGRFLNIPIHYGDWVPITAAKALVEEVARGRLPHSQPAEKKVGTDGKLSCRVRVSPVTLNFIVAAVRADLQLPTNGPEYFDNTLESIQGALQDTIRAGLDLENMESRLRSIVDDSSYFFRAESAVEYAVAVDPYQNAWNGAGGSTAEGTYAIDKGVIL